MIKTIIIDDEPLAVELVAHYVQEQAQLHLMATFTDSVKALRYLQTHEVDLVFLDIEMPLMSGVELVRQAKAMPLFIFTTAYPDYALQGFELSAVDYLVKPIAPERFTQAVDKVLQRLAYANTAQRSIMVRSEYDQVKILLDDIWYVEGLGDYLKIHTADGAVLTLMNFKNLLSLLPSDQFLRVHRSYVVASRHVTSANRRRLTMVNGVDIPIGATYKAEVAEQLGL